MGILLNSKKKPLASEFQKKNSSLPIIQNTRRNRIWKRDWYESGTTEYELLGTGPRTGPHGPRPCIVSRPALREPKWNMADSPTTYFG